jgi:hypothetical protein
LISMRHIVLTGKILKSHLQEGGDNKKIRLPSGSNLS